MINSIIWNSLKAVEIKAGGYEALLIPQMGANLVRLYHTATGIDILHTPTVDEIETFLQRPQIFGLPLLFPPNRIEDGAYSYNGVNYQYPITIPDQNNYHHGNIKSQPFVVTKCREGVDYAMVEASYFSNCVNNEIYQYFPHNFECKMSFCISDKGLKHTVTFINLDKTEMPLGVGYHTPINIPFIKGSDPKDYKLRLSAGEKWELNDRTLPTEKLLPLSETETLLRGEGMTPIGYPIEVALTASPIEVDGRPYNGAVVIDTKSGHQVCYEVDDQVKHWTLWNNGGDAAWVCPEPQTWAINAPNLKLSKEITGFQTVLPESSWSTVSKIYVK